MAQKEKDRNKMIRTIQLARRRLDLDEETYRKNLKLASGGDTSLRDMTLEQLWKVIQYFQYTLGFSFGFSGDLSMASDDQSRLIRHLWLQLNDYGELRNPSERALAAYAKKITKVDRLEWLKTEQAQKVIETLKKWVDRIECKIIEEALNSGILHLPEGFVSYNHFRGFQPDPFNVKLYSAIFAFRTEVTSYLSAYKPRRLE